MEMKCENCKYEIAYYDGKWWHTLQEKTRHGRYVQHSISLFKVVFHPDKVLCKKALHPARGEGEKKGEKK